MLHAKALRSPHPHARIISIDTVQAEQVPGVACVITGKDAPTKRYGVVIRDEMVLSQDGVRAIGVPVAAVAAETIEAAEQALGLIDVHYEVLPALFDPEEAMSTKPPVVIHPDLSAYDYMRPSIRPLDSTRPNVFSHYMIRRGDAEKGFAESDVVMEHRFSAARVQHCHLETMVATAQPEADGGLTLWISKQQPERIRSEMSRLFDLPPSKVRVFQPYIGGSFGGKEHIREESIVALLALKTGRPVRLVYTREEAFLCGGTRTPMIIYIKDGARKDGTLVARQIKAIIPAGGQSEHITGMVARNAAFGAAGVYRIPNFTWDSYGVYINEPTVLALRGFGNVLSTWAIESHMDMLALKLGIDPVEIRRKNLLREGEANLTGEIIHSTGLKQCLEKAAESIRLHEHPPEEGVWRRGKGIGIGCKYTGAPSASMVRVKVMEDGSIVVYHGGTEEGQGCDTVMAQIAAEEFGIPVDKVRIASKDSLHTPYDLGTASSRTTYHTGNAVRLACQDAKRQLFERVGQKLGVSPDELETTEGTVYVKGMPWSPHQVESTEGMVDVKGMFDKKLQIAELFAGYTPESYGTYTVDGEIIGNATFVQDNTPEDRMTGQIDPTLAAAGKRLNASYAYTAKAAEVAVNTETGEVKVVQCVAASDMGQPINPKMCEQQAEGGIGMGIGAAVYEEMIVKEGNVLNPNFSNYRIPSPNFSNYRIPSVNEMPTIDNIKTIIAPALHKDGPYGAKGFAESGLVGIDAAIGNAVYNAVGVRIKDLPISAEKVLKALQEKKGSSK
jgi:carbon-monoxide dehydrogenase large subunit